MTVRDWLAIASIVIVVVGALLRHVMNDAKYRAKVDEHGRRLSALDGINGVHKD